MFAKIETTTRERKMYNNYSNRNGSLKTSRNIQDSKELERWFKTENSKRGGKSRFTRGYINNN